MASTLNRTALQPQPQAQSQQQQQQQQQQEAMLHREAEGSESSGSSSEDRLSLGRPAEIAVAKRSAGANEPPEFQPKKRRKQTTPLKFASALPNDEQPPNHHDNDEDDGDDENEIGEDEPTEDEHEAQENGSAARTLPQIQVRTSLQINSIKRDLERDLEQEQEQEQEQEEEEEEEEEEGLLNNNEYRCQFCAQYFADRENLELHLECDHGLPPATMAQMLKALPHTAAPAWLAHNHRLPAIPNFAQFLPLQPAPDFRPGPLHHHHHQPPAPRIFNPDAYCELCNKEFCNKYFLKTHRANKHGIYTDPPIVPEPSLTAIAAAHHHQQQQQQQQNLFKPKLEQREGSRSPGGIESLFKQELALEQPEQPGQRPLLPGVMNPEAFCELCCKEYCNKYFLRTHKLKKHGILVPESDGKSPSASSSPPAAQTSPLNLILVAGNGSSESSSGPLADEQHKCRLCGISFQTPGLHRLHLERIHQLGGGSGPEELISEDLQKLQTMILQLKGLESNKAASCALCGKDCDSPQQLRAHMTGEHGVAPENLLEKSPGADSPPGELLRKLPAPSQQEPVPAYQQPPAPPPPPTPPHQPHQPQHRLTPSKQTGFATPTSSYCEICNKELCNKYFMKTHMQKMHGIEIENGSQIGGVICNICNKELCSKYFLRVHKQNTHGIVEDGAKLDGTTTTTTTTDSPQAPAAADEAAPGPAIKPPEHPQPELTQRYFTHFTEVCPLCNRRFRTAKWLKTHLQSEHGKPGLDKWREVEALLAGQQQQQQQQAPASPAKSPRATPKPHASPLKVPNGSSDSLAAVGNHVLSNLLAGGGDSPDPGALRCPDCGLVTNNLPFFFYHERMHHQQQQQQQQQHQNEVQSEPNAGEHPCPVCAQDFATELQLRQHVLARHSLPGLLSQLPLLPAAPESGEPAQQQQQQQAPTATASPCLEMVQQGVYRCGQCQLVSANLNRMKKHLRREHASLGDPQEAALLELARTLKDVANKHKLPVSWGLPQESGPQQLATAKPLMQPFFLEEPSQQFAPALVYLPVRERLTEPTSLTFSLSPA